MSVLVQWASLEYARMLRLTEELHAARCAVSGITYTRGYSRLTERGGFADKAKAISNALNAADEGDNVVYLDADCILDGSAADLFGANPGDLGMVKNILGTFNTGVIWMKNQPYLRTFWEWIADLNTQDKRVSNTLILDGVLRSHISEVEARFNLYRWSQQQTGITPVVSAWHDLSTIEAKVVAMTAHLAEIDD